MAIVASDGIPVTDTQGRRGTLHVEAPKTVYGGWVLEAVLGHRVETQCLGRDATKALIVKLLATL